MCWRARGAGFAGIRLVAPLFPNLPIYPTLCLHSKRTSVLEEVDKVPKTSPNPQKTKHSEACSGSLYTPLTIFLCFLLSHSQPFSPFSSFLAFNALSLMKMEFSRHRGQGQDCRDLYIKKHRSPLLEVHLSLQFNYCSPLYTCRFMICNSTSQKFGISRSCKEVNLVNLNCGLFFKTRRGFLFCHSILT